MTAGQKQYAANNHDYPDRQSSAKPLSETLDCLVREPAANRSQHRDSDIGHGAADAGVRYREVSLANQIDKQPGVIKVDWVALAEVAPQQSPHRAACNHFAPFNTRALGS